jgi:hypothetical protein
MIRLTGESPLVLSFQSMAEEESGGSVHLRVEDGWDVVYPPGFLYRVNEKVRPLFAPISIRAVGGYAEVSKEGLRSLSDEEIAELNSHVQRFGNLWRWEWLLIAWGLMGATSLIVGLTDSTGQRLIATIVIVASIWAGLSLWFRRLFSAQLRASLAYCLVRVDEHPEIEGMSTESLKPHDIDWTYNGEPASWRLTE